MLENFRGLFPRVRGLSQTGRIGHVGLGPPSPRVLAYGHRARQRKLGRSPSSRAPNGTKNRRLRTGKRRRGTSQRNVPHHFWISKIFKKAQQNRDFRLRLIFWCTHYPQSLRWDYDFSGIFWVGPPSHSVFLKKYGKKVMVTHTTQIQLSGRCDTREG